MICSLVVSPHRKGQIQTQDLPAVRHNYIHDYVILSSQSSVSSGSQRVSVNLSSQVTLKSVERQPLHVKWDVITPQNS